MGTFKFLKHLKTQNLMDKTAKITESELLTDVKAQ